MDELFKARSELYVLRAQSGDPDAMDLLIALWSPRLSSMVSQWVPASFTAEVAQQVWLDVFGHLAGLNEPASFPSWIRRIAFRCAATMLRQRKAHARIDPDASSYELAPSWLPILVGLLGPTHRRVFTMHYLEGYSVEEIGECLELPVGTIKSRLHTSRRLLRRQLGNSLEN
jgi:RNA polymerase sigma-70 factor (ECF subfamily)